MNSSATPPRPNPKIFRNACFIFAGAIFLCLAFKTFTPRLLAMLGPGPFHVAWNAVGTCTLFSLAHFCLSFPRNARIADWAHVAGKACMFVALYIGFITLRTGYQAFFLPHSELIGKWQSTSDSTDVLEL